MDVGKATLIKQSDSLRRGLQACQARLAAVEAERDAARAELRYVLRKAIEAAGGVAQEGASDAFLTLVPAKVGALKHKCGKLEAALLAAQAGEARAVEALRRIAAAPGCGCKPICRCRTLESRSVELEAKMDIAFEVVDASQPALDWLAQREREAAAKENERCAENAALRKIAVDLHWMARRYADGRMSTAPEMFNDAVKALLAMGINLNKTSDQIIWARNSMGRRYDGLTNAQATPGTPEALGDAAALRAGKGTE